MVWLTERLDNLNEVIMTMEEKIDTTLRTKAINALFKYNRVGVILDNGYHVVVDEVVFKEDDVIFKAGNDKWNSNGISNTTKSRIIDVV